MVATAAAQDLVVYLLSRKQTPIAGSAAPGEAAAAPESGKRGAAVFAGHCASCHGANGEGVPGVFPPLKGNPVVTATDPAEHIHVVLFGKKGGTIKGATYSAQMPAWADQLSDEEVAAVVNHERTSWGNSAPTVTTDNVAKIRKKGGP